MPFLVQYGDREDGFIFDSTTHAEARTILLTMNVQDDAFNAKALKGALWVATKGACKGWQVVINSRYELSKRLRRLISKRLGKVLKYK